VLRVRREARQRDYRAAIKQIRLRHPNFQVFDIMPLLCDERYCSRIKDHVLYSDDDHIGVYGSMLPPTEERGRALGSSRGGL
jgi:hypothetical protein